jgi:hypothetical protein
MWSNYYIHCHGQKRVDTLGSDRIFIMLAENYGHNRQQAANVNNERRWGFLT